MQAGVGDAGRPARPPRALRGSPVDRLQPRRVGALLDAGFDVLRFRARTLFLVSAGILLPLAVVPQALSYRGLGGSGLDLRLNLSNGSFLPSETSALGADDLLGALVLGALPLLAMALLGLAMGHLVGGWLAGEDPGPAVVLRSTLRQAPVALAAYLIALPLKAAGFAACYVGAVIVIGQLQILSPVIAFERLGPLKAIGRSWRLSSRRFFRGPGLVLGLALVTAAVSTALLGIQTLVAQLLKENSWGWAVAGGIGTGITMLLAPFQAAVAVLHYLDLRVRAEGLDLQLRATEAFDRAR